MIYQCTPKHDQRRARTIRGTTQELSRYLSWRLCCLARRRPRMWLFDAIFFFSGRISHLALNQRAMVPVCSTRLKPLTSDVVPFSKILEITELGVKRDVDASWQAHNLDGRIVDARPTAYEVHTRGIWLRVDVSS